MSYKTARICQNAQGHVHQTVYSQQLGLPNHYYLPTYLE